jgi:hypothetical protein
LDFSLKLVMRGERIACSLMVRKVQPRTPNIF